MTVFLHVATAMSVDSPTKPRATHGYKCPSPYVRDSPATLVADVPYAPLQSGSSVPQHDVTVRTRAGGNGAYDPVNVLSEAGTSHLLGRRN